MSTYISRPAFLVRSLNRGGAERQLIELVKQLSRCGNSPTVFVFYSNGAFTSELEMAGINVITLYKKNRWDVLGFFLQMILQIRSTRPTLLHSYGTVPNFFSILLKPFFPALPIIWGIRASNVDLRRYDMVTGLFYILERLLASLPDLIIANSQAGLDYAVQQNYPRNKIIMIPNGFDTERFRPNTVRGLEIRSIWGVTSQDVVIGLVGRIDPMKDHPTFLRAVASVLYTHYEVRCVCVGGYDTPYRRELQRLSVELGIAGRVQWIDEGFDMPSIYNALNILCSASAYGEGFSNAIGEAMACGVPCVVTDVGDSARIVGDTGIIVPPKDPSALSKGIELLLCQNLENLGINARERICKDFSVQQLGERTLQAIDQLCAAL